MRFLLVIALVATTAAADPLPPGALGIVTGGTSGTGADAKRIGAGLYAFGLQAAWQPMNTDRRFGWTIRWATMFGILWGGNVAQIEPSLRTVQMDLTGGFRFRPWAEPSRYLTMRGGVEALRTNEPLLPSNHRSFVGGIAEIGFDKHFSSFLFSLDVRYGLFGSEPSNIALLFGIAVTGP